MLNRAFCQLLAAWSAPLAIQKVSTSRMDSMTCARVGAGTGSAAPAPGSAAPPNGSAANGSAANGSAAPAWPGVPSSTAGTATRPARTPRLRMALLCLRAGGMVDVQVAQLLIHDQE